jgi:hypothetical protein
MSDGMADSLEVEMISRLQAAIGERKRGIISKDECLRRIHAVAAELEQDQWRIIEDLRTRAPDNVRELAREVADLLEKELRKGSGTA